MTNTQKYKLLINTIRKWEKGHKEVVVSSVMASSTEVELTMTLCSDSDTFWRGMVWLDTPGVEAYLSVNDQLDSILMMLRDVGVCNGNVHQFLHDIIDKVRGLGDYPAGIIFSVDNPVVGTGTSRAVLLSIGFHPPDGSKPFTKTCVLTNDAVDAFIAGDEVDMDYTSIYMSCIALRESWFPHN